MRHIRIYLISLCLMMVTACDDSDPSKGCKKNSDCSDVEQVCNTHTDKCEAQTSQENKCHSDVDCQSTSETPICNTVTGKCEAQTSQENKCQSDVDCQSTSETPICNKVTGKCEAQTSQENKCHTDGDCPTDSPKCIENTGKCVVCLLNNDCTNDEKPRCIHETGKCEALNYGKKHVRPMRTARILFIQNAIRILKNARAHVCPIKTVGFAQKMKSAWNRMFPFAIR